MTLAKDALKELPSKSPAGLKHLLEELVISMSEEDKDYFTPA